MWFATSSELHRQSYSCFPFKTWSGDALALEYFLLSFNGTPHSRLLQQVFQFVFVHICLCGTTRACVVQNSSICSAVPWKLSADCSMHKEYVFLGTLVTICTQGRMVYYNYEVTWSNRSNSLCVIIVIKLVIRMIIIISNVCSRVFPKDQCNKAFCYKEMLNWGVQISSSASMRELSSVTE